MSNISLKRFSRQSLNLTTFRIILYAFLHVASYILIGPIRNLPRHLAHIFVLVFVLFKNQKRGNFRIIIIIKIKRFEDAMRHVTYIITDYWNSNFHTLCYCYIAPAKKFVFLLVARDPRAPRYTFIYHSPMLKGNM